VLKLIRKALHSARAGICEDVAVWGREDGLDVLELDPLVYRDVAYLRLQPFMQFEVL